MRNNMNLSNDFYKNIYKTANKMSKQIEVSEPEPYDFFNNNAGATAFIASLYAYCGGSDKEMLSLLNEYVVDIKDFCEENVLEEFVANEQIALTYALSMREMAFGFYNVSGHSKNMASILEFVNRILEGNEISSVFLPYGLEGQFKLINEKKNWQIKGFTNSNRSKALAKIVSGIDLDLYQTSFETTEKYDLVFAQPEIKINGNDETFNTLTKCLEMVKPESGNFVCIFPERWSYTDEVCFVNFRKYLIESGYNIANIQISNPYLGDDLCLLFVESRKQHIVMTANLASDAFFSVTDFTMGIVSLKVESMLESIKQNDLNHVWIGRSSEVSGNFNLYPSRYLIKNIELYDFMCEFKDAIRLVTPCNYVGTSGDKYFVGVKDLHDEYYNCEISLDQAYLVNNQESLHGKFNVIDEPCLCCTFINGVAKVGKITSVPKNSSILVDKSIITFQVNNDVILDDFFLRTLLDKEIIKQAGWLTYNDSCSEKTNRKVSKILRPEDFLLIRMKCWDLETQKDRLDRDIKQFYDEAKASSEKSFEEFRKDMHMKKHAVGQTLFNLNNWFQVLMQARAQANGLLADDAMVGKVRKIKVSDIYANLESSLSRLKNQINKFDSGFGMVAKEFALTTFFEKYIETHQSPMFKFVYDKQKHYANVDLRNVEIDEEKGTLEFKDGYILNANDPLEYITFPEDALATIMDDIVSNACSHGFSTQNGKENLIKIEIESEGTSYVVTVSNNGAVLDKALQPEEVFTYARTTKSKEEHSGIGGYEIRNLMKEFNGEVTLINEPGNEFPFGYRLVFNKTNIIASL